MICEDQTEFYAQSPRVMSRTQVVPRTTSCFMWKSMLHVSADCKRQGNYFYSGLMTAGTQLRVTEGFSDNP